MDSSTQDSRAKVHPQLVLGNWCYRDIIKQKMIDELNYRRQPKSISSPREQPETQNHRTRHGDTEKDYRTVDLMQKALHDAEDEMQKSIDNQMGILGSRHPHRVRLMKNFPRSQMMSDAAFLDILWNILQSSEKALCEDHLGSDGTAKEGGYRKAFQYLQHVHGTKHMDDLLEQEAKIRWNFWLEKESGSRRIISNQALLSLGSRKLQTIKYPAPVAEVDCTNKRKDCPGSAFDGKKKVRVVDPQSPVLLPRLLPNLAKQNHRARAVPPRPRRRSALYKEIRFEDFDEDI